MNDAARARLASRVACVLLALALWAVAAAPLARPGMIAGHDTVEHALLGVATADALGAGVFPLPTLPALYGGMGCHAIQYHCPGFYYPLAALIRGGWTPYGAEQLVMGLAMLAGLFGMLVWCGRTHGVWGGLVAGVAFLYAPYYLADLYWRVALPELVALALLPWLLDLLARHVEGGARRHGALAAAGIAYLMALHAPTALMGAVLFACHGLACALGEPDTRARLARLARVGALAVSLGAVYWLPTVVDVPRLNVVLEGTFVDYRDHFQTLPHLLDDEWSHTTGKGSPLHMGRAQVALAAAALAALPLVVRQSRARARGAAAALVCLVISVFMCHGASQPVWDRFATVRNVFFPWRWLGPAALALGALAPVCAGAVLRWLAPSTEADVTRRAVGQAFVHLPLVLMLAASGYRMVDARVEQQPEPDLARVRLQGDWLWNHYIPRGALPVYGERAVAAVRQGEGRVVDARVIPGHVQARVQMGTAGTVALATYAYPEWRAFVDGAEVPAGREPIEGGLLVAVTPGEHVVDARFAWPAARLGALAAGALALGAFLAPPGRARPLALACGAAWAFTLVRAGLDWPAPPGATPGGLAEQVFAGERWTGATTATTGDLTSRRFTGPAWLACTGAFTLDAPAPCRFEVRSDDGCYLFVDGRCVVDCGRSHSAQLGHGDVDLGAGDHTVAVLYFNASSTGVLAASMQRLGAYPVPLAAPHVRPAAAPWLAAAIAEAVRRGP